MLILQRNIFLFNTYNRNLFFSKIMVKIRPDEISSIIRQQIEQYNQTTRVLNVGIVFQIEMASLGFMDWRKS